MAFTTVAFFRMAFYEYIYLQGKVEGPLSPGVGFFSIATYKLQNMEEVNIFVTAEI